MYNRPKEAEQDFKGVKRRFKSLAEQLFAPLFPGYKEHAIEQRQLKIKLKIKRKHGKDNQQPRSFEEDLFEVIYRPQVQKFIQEHIELYEDDQEIHILQISYLQILNFLEKILETELYILEGTGFGWQLDPGTGNIHGQKDLLSIHGQNI